MDMMVSLDDELARFVEGQIATGRFRSSSDLVREALRLMETTERRDADNLRWLREAWQDGLDSGDAGEIDFTALKAEARGRRTPSIS
ncbi:type II toxin-antitoxin system ParD family antitoxin [Lichenibacterium ramalinae]|uniref:Type II toxin-antitoxin system ParD family antitoxin n=1 Tax=Lichenibacterium ramalinae TaxID=2316527 RepID=A0A4Q2RCG4_9HYPH|nr:type II toxin-antitoxin system ParD family antitoxin [Lichenibacterium ramalinae]RYB03467.1 type II toxin-antitoxin system ParD family antitoxin [Lichenibacterium ramalinae]